MLHSRFYKLRSECMYVKNIVKSYMKIGGAKISDAGQGQETRNPLNTFLYNCVLPKNIILSRHTFLALRVVFCNQWHCCVLRLPMLAERLLGTFLSVSAPTLVGPRRPAPSHLPSLPREPL